MDKAYYVYIIRSQEGRYYIGQTGNLEERITRHKEGRSKATRGYSGWELVRSVKCNSRKEAILLENKLKSYKNAEKALEHLSGK